jgi:ubiquinol-cytochrome c reductase cytochrome b subunit
MSRLGDYLEDRIGLRRRMKSMLEHPIAGGPSWARSVGFTLLFLLVTLVATGLALMTTYAPTVESAWASVHFTTYLMPHGWLLRGLHRFAGEAMLVLACAHVAMLAMGGAHRRPRELGYLAAVFATFSIAAACITGGVLPWDQQGYWARRVEIGIMQMGPGGGELARLAQGGAELGQLGLTRMFAIHVIVLPLIIAALFRLRRRSEWTFAEKIAARHNSGFESYVPRQLARDLALAASAALLVGYMTNKVHGAPLDAPADPASDYPARPEWYLMWLYEVRRHVHGPMEFWGTLGVPFAIGLVFVALPWIDKKAHGASIIGIIAVVAAAAAIGGLTYVSMDRDAHDAKFQKARADANRRASVALALAKKGVPPAGPLVMLRDDPELHARAIFTDKCAHCHVLGDLGDKKKADAPVLDGWSTEAWIMSMLHDPDGEDRFGRTPYKGDMPSMDVAPKEDPKNEKADFKPMSKDDMTSVAKFLATGDGEGGEKIIKDRCTTCHLYKGEGDDNGEETAPELAGFGTLAWVRAQIADPSTPATYRKNALGKHHMPKFAGELSPADIELVARFTLAKARGQTFP